jgi:hypothetical protein
MALLTALDYHSDGLLYRVRLLTRLATSGVVTLEGTSRGQRIPVRRGTIVAFLGPAMRGPVNIPVSIRSLAEFRKRFGSPVQRCELQRLLSEFFESGGRKAIVIRVCQTSRRNRILLDSPAGPLVLEAVNPGPSEFLRASVDYDNIPGEEEDRFNLVVHRLSSPSSFIVEQQEIFVGASVDPDDPNYIGHLLLNSNLIRVIGEAPTKRPDSTLMLSGGESASYVYADTGWQNFEAFTDYDLIGSDREGTGIFALDRVPIIDLVCMFSGSEGGDIGPVALFAAEQYCRARNAILLIDPPSQWSSAQMAHESCGERSVPGHNMMTYFPRLVAAKAVNGCAVGENVSALGAIAGAIVAEDEKYGIAGALQGKSIRVRSRHRIAVPLSDDECETLEKSGVNALQPGDQGCLDLGGLVTFAPRAGIDTDWESLRKRRAAIFIIDGIARGTRWAMFESSAPELWADVAAQIENFLDDLFDSGNLTGKTSRESFYVICNHQTNDIRKQSDRDSETRRISFMVSFSLSPGEMLAFRFTHDADGCTVKRVVWQPGIALAS